MQEEEEELEFREQMYKSSKCFTNKFLKSFRKFAPMKFSILKNRILELDQTGDIRELDPEKIVWKSTLPKKRCNHDSMIILTSNPARCSICKEVI